MDLLVSLLRNWLAEFFPSTIGSAATVDIISSGMGGTRKGVLQLVWCSTVLLNIFAYDLLKCSSLPVLFFAMKAANVKNWILLMQAQFQVLSLLIPACQVKFLRFCEQQTEGIWALVDVSVDAVRAGGNGGCRRLPSGCIIQDMSNGHSRVTDAADAMIFNCLFGHLYSDGARMLAKAVATECNLHSSTFLPHQLSVNSVVLDLGGLLLRKLRDIDFFV